MDKRETPKILPRLDNASSAYHELVDLIERQLWQPGLWLHKTWLGKVWPRAEGVVEVAEIDHLEELLIFRDKYGHMRLEQEREAFYRRGGGKAGAYDPYARDPFDPSTWPIDEQMELELREQAEVS